MPAYTVREKKAISKCARCGTEIEFCTRDNPCPSCGSSQFTVEYVEE